MYMYMYINSINICIYIPEIEEWRVDADEGEEVDEKLCNGRRILHVH
jgi:hypothetical protein